MPQTSTTEQWAPIPGYEGLYEVSDHGQVRSLPRTATRKNGVTQQVKGRTLKVAIRADGHAQCSLWKENHGKTHKVHRLVAAAFVPGQRDGVEVCHNNGQDADNRAENLRWDTRSSNMLDRQKHGTDHKRNRTHCPYGHEHIAENNANHQRVLGHRQCLACCRARAYIQKHPDLIDQFPTVADRYYQAITQEVQRA